MQFTHTVMIFITSKGTNIQPTSKASNALEISSAKLYPGSVINQSLSKQGRSLECLLESNELVIVNIIQLSQVTETTTENGSRLIQTLFKVTLLITFYLPLDETFLIPVLVGSTYHR